MKQKLHASHPGTESCLRRPRETKFWRNMNAKVKEMIATCKTCPRYEAGDQEESLIPHKAPIRPWEQVGVDLFELNKKEYMITGDYYGNFWGIDRITSTTSSAVVFKLHPLWGARDGAVVRALASHQCGLGSNPGIDAICGFICEFVVSPLLCSVRFFSGHSGFPLSSKTNIFKFQFDQTSGRRRTTLWMCYLQIIIYIYL